MERGYHHHTFHKAVFFRHVFLEAALYGRTSIVQHVGSYMTKWTNSQRARIWITAEHKGFVCNAVELAALSGFEDTTAALLDLGCFPSENPERFKQEILVEGILQAAFEAGDVARFSVSLKNLRSHCRRSGIPRRPDTYTSERRKWGHIVSSHSKTSFRGQRPSRIFYALGLRGQQGHFTQD